MVMFVGPIRVEDRPSLRLSVHLDPDQDRARVAEVLRARRAAESPPWAPWPAPAIPMREVDGATLSGGPARLLSRLRAAQWRVVVTHCRGTLTEARDGFTGKGAERRPKHYPAKIVDSWAVRAGKGNRRAVAIWHGVSGKLTSEGVLVWGDRYAQWIGLREFEGGI